jgi:mycofactocin biosynthesis protein MftB
MTAGFDAGRPYEKHPQVAIRREEFGGLAYHFGNRRLVFLKAPELVVLVEVLGDFPSASEAMAACVPAGRRPAAGKALSRLLASEVIRPRHGAPGESGG